MTPDIIRKLTAELDSGIKTEVQVVYLLTGIRKLIERDKKYERYPDLKFHCDWALHSHLEGAGAQKILRQFDAAHVELRKGNVELDDLPQELQNEIDRISKMRSFKRELREFLSDYGLPSLDAHNDGWPHFLHLYAQVIEDIPLVVAAPKPSSKAKSATAPQYISSVTVSFEFARETIKLGDYEDVLYRLTWIIEDKNGLTGSLFVANTYNLKRPDIEEAQLR